MKAIKTMAAGLVGTAFLMTFAAEAFCAITLYPSCAKGTVEQVGSGYVAPTYGAYTNYVFPTYRWARIRCTAAGDAGYSTYGGAISTTATADTYYDYLIHPSWDQDGKMATLLTALAEGREVSYALLRNLNTYPNAVQNSKWLMSVSILPSTTTTTP